MFHHCRNVSLEHPACVLERGVTRFGFVTDEQSVVDGAWTRGVPGLSADGPPLQSRGIWLQTLEWLVQQLRFERTLEILRTQGLAPARDERVAA